MDLSRKITSGLLLSIGCGSPTAGPDAPRAGADGPTSIGNGHADAAVDAGPLDVPGHTPGMPGLGAHAMQYYHLPDSGGTNPPSIATPTMVTQTGSMIVVGVGRGMISKFVPPTDNKSNGPYKQLGEIRNYEPRWPNSGTGIYTFTSAKGGSDFTVSTSTDPGDEITLAAVEVIEGTHVQDFAWNELTDTPATSLSVTTTGPATLIAFWWGDGFFYNPPLSQTATPDNNFVPIDFNTQETNSFVQSAVAVKNVTSPGKYKVTWEATPAQGAQLWLIAVQ